MTDNAQRAPCTVPPLVQCCRTCALWKIEQAQDKAGRIRKDRVALCKWRLTEPIPASLHKWYKEPSPHYMPPDGGSDCKCWKERTPNTQAEVRR